jgi:hypothetical protein
MTQDTTWTPRAGEIVHFKGKNTPELTGRYRLDTKEGEPGYFAFTRLRSGKAHMLIAPGVLKEWHDMGTITLIDPDEIERDKLHQDYRAGCKRLTNQLSRIVRNQHRFPVDSGVNERLLDRCAARKRELDALARRIF